MNHFGRLFQVSIFGESHGDAVGIVVDGVKPGIPLKELCMFLLPLLVLSFLMKKGIYLRLLTGN